MERSFKPSSGEYFACKSVDRDLLTDSTDCECLEKESKTMALLSSHPNTVRLYEDENSLHMVMDLCDSTDLYQVISKSSMFETKASSIMKSLMSSLAHCHARGICHCDVKPDNVLFDLSYKLRLADFLSSKWFGDGRTMTSVVGTSYYAAPEVLIGMGYNEKIYVWSASVIMYIMLAGFVPFYSESAAEIFEAVLRGNLRFSTRIFRSVSPSTKDLLRKMLCKDASR